MCTLCYRLAVSIQLEVKATCACMCVIVLGTTMYIVCSISMYMYIQSECVVCACCYSLNGVQLVFIMYVNMGRDLTTYVIT